MRALISTSDRTGLPEFAKILHLNNTEILSTGQTGAFLASFGIPITLVSEITGFPEILDGRVKTLHPKIHGGLLAKRDSSEHAAQLKKHGIQPIDIVVVNLYPFADTIKNPSVSLEVALEQIDIGGPALLRAAAKNFLSVVPIVDPSDYQWIADKLTNGELSAEERKRLAAKAFRHTAEYDSTVANYLSETNAPPFAERFCLNLDKIRDLSYGENPHQSAAIYTSENGAFGVANALQLHGPDLSFNNLLDADSALRTVFDFREPTVAVIKHTNPCGLASHPNVAEAYKRALAGDPVSAYGGIIACNELVTSDMAAAMHDILYHIIIAPSYDDDALAILKKRKSLRVLKVIPSPRENSSLLDFRPVSGGVLVQESDLIHPDISNWDVVTTRKPEKAELEDMLFAWTAAKNIKSNAIVFAKGKSLIGMGAGQPNRVTSIHLASRIAGDSAAGCVMASDAFLPFSDNIEEAARAGIISIIQPGGSIRDTACISKANALGIAMVFTGARHFRH